RRRHTIFSRDGSSDVCSSDLIKLALGARGRHIIAQFVLEALLLAMTGGVLGLAVAVAIILFVDSLPNSNEATVLLLNPKLSWPIGLSTVSILTLIGLAAGVFPARKAAAPDPVESVRYGWPWQV